MHRSRHVSGMCELPLMNKAHASTRDAHSPEVISPKSNFFENESYRLCVPVTNRKTLKLSNKDNPSRLRAVVIISNFHFVRSRRSVSVTSVLARTSWNYRSVS